MDYYFFGNLSKYILISIGMRVERTSNTSRELSLDVGIVNEASGSAKYRMGQTVATAVVLGPSVPKFQRHEDYRAMTVEVTYSMSLGGGSGAGDSAIAVGNELKRIERECTLCKIWYFGGNRYHKEPSNFARDQGNHRF